MVDLHLCFVVVVVVVVDDGGGDVGFIYNGLIDYFNLFFHSLTHTIPTHFRVHRLIYIITIYYDTLHPVCRGPGNSGCPCTPISFP